MCESDDRFIRVEHAQTDPSISKVEDDRAFFLRTIVGCEHHFEFARFFENSICCFVLVSECVPSNDDWLRPARYETGYIRTQNRLPEHGAAEDVTNGSVWTRVHSSEIVFLYAILVRSDRSTFDAHVVLEDGLGGIDCYLKGGRLSFIRHEVQLEEFHDV